MIRNRFPRFRNLQNLHVIPTASNINIGPKKSKSKSPDPGTPQNISVMNSDKNFRQNKTKNGKNKYNEGHKSKKQRKRNERHLASLQPVENNSSDWYDPNYVSAVESTTETNEEVENISEAPVEEDFEEVEVASFDGDGKQILITYQKTKIFYLKSKKNCFFKPKIYEFFPQRTFVNCLNVQDNSSIDVDVVSEAEYETDCEADNLDQSESEEIPKTAKAAEDNSKDTVKSDPVEINQTVRNKDEDKSALRAYKTCIEDNVDLYQGKSLIQDSLDSWKSHLIGLEYLIEIQNESKNLAVKYHCVICCKNLQVKEFPAISIINHINGCKHVSKYLEKHFPTLWYEYAESNDSNVVLQKLCEEINRNLGYYFMCITNFDFYEMNEQKIKDIIQNASHANEKDLKLDKSLFQKIVNFNLMEEVKDSMNGIINTIIQLEGKSETSDYELNKNIPSILEIKSNSEALSNLKVDPVKISDRKGKTCLSKESIVNKLKSPKSFKKFKGQSTLSSYLKQRYARTRFKKPFKGLLKINKVASFENENVSSRGTEITADETSCTKSAKSNEAVPDLANYNASKKAVRNKSKEKVMQKSTMHSKHCRKRILGKENSRLRVAAKSSTKDDFVTGVLNKSKMKCVSVSESVSHGGSSKRNISDKDLRYSEISVTSSYKNSPLHKITSVPVQQISRIESKLPSTRFSKSPHRRIVHKKGIESAKGEISVVIKNSLDWKTVTKTSKSPTKSPTQNSSHIHSKTPAKKLSRSPIKRSVRKRSKSPMHQNRSPLRQVIRAPLRSPVRRFSKTPVRRRSRSPARRHSRSPARRHSRSPFRRNSRSPVRRKSRSPVRRKSRSPVRRKSRSPMRRKSRSPVRRKSRSPVRRKSRSPVRRKSRSPVRRKSRSPVRRKSRSPVRRKSRSPYWKHSRSPVRRKSRSPLRRQSRSPLRRQSRSPLRRQSRSPLRRQSRSPLRRQSRSPLRRQSRSPMRRQSRSPLRQFSRSSLKQHSRSPMRRHSRSPLKWHSRSPMRRHPRSPSKIGRILNRKLSRSPIKRLSKSPIKEFTSIYTIHSPNIGHSSSVRGHIIPKERFSSKVYRVDKHLSPRDTEYSKMRSTVKTLSPSMSSVSDRYKSHIFSQGISDLDPVSDEDESVYFDKQHVEDIKASSSSRMMLAQLFQKFSMPDSSPNDPSLDKFAQFMESHSAEIQELMGSQSVSKPGKLNLNKIDPGVEERSLFLQQYLLRNLAGGGQEQGLPSASNVPPKYQQPPFLSDNVHSAYEVYGHAPNIASHNLPNPPRIFPPNINVPPPEPYHKFNPPHQEFSPKSQVPPEVMFKDLKATVNKLFGANEGTAKQVKIKPQVPGYVTVPDPEKWDFNHPDTPKFNPHIGVKFNDPASPKFNAHIGPRFNTPIGQKNVFHSQGKNVEFGGGAESSVMRAEIPVMFNSNNPPGQYFGGRGIDRPQAPNVSIPPPDAKVSFCDIPRSSKGNLFPVVHNVQGNSNFGAPTSRDGVCDVKVSLAQRLASVLVKVGMTDVPAPLLQEMLMKIGAFSSSPRQDISEGEIISILKRLGYLS